MGNTHNHPQRFQQLPHVGISHSDFLALQCTLCNVTMSTVLRAHKFHVTLQTYRHNLSLAEAMVLIATIMH